MSSTRNKNTLGDYNLERMMDQKCFQIMSYTNSSSGSAVFPALPVGGSAPPSKLSYQDLSNNAIAIESQLFGIGTTNLVKLYQPILPQPKVLPSVKYFYRNKVIMPENLQCESNQRPFPV